jgi:long-chain fatty acid transport protein
MRKKLAVTAVLLLAPVMSYGAGFALFEAGNRGLGMAGAFTAVADDPSAMFWNSAGLAFQIDKGIQVVGGTTLIAPEQSFSGADPYPGFGYYAEQESQIFTPLHAYFVLPLSDKTTFGFSILTPFGLGTWWEDDHAGRFISKRVDLFAFDFSPNLAFKLTDYLAFGIGVDYRVSTIDLTRNVPFVDPFQQQVVDVAQVHIFTDGAGNDGWGWHAGLLGDLGAGFKVGLNYRSAITVDYEGYAEFAQFSTGNPELDAIVAATLPFDETISGVTKIAFPDYWTVGLSWSSEKWTVSGQYGRMGWSSFQELELIFPNNPEFNETIPEDYEDSSDYRFGVEFRASSKIAIQAGAVYDETPQPTHSMSPLLGDADRIGYNAGLSWIHRTWRLDLGGEYLTIDERSTEGTSEAGYDGIYDGSAILAGATFTFYF